jgi:hypothetical protein
MTEAAALQALSRDMARLRAAGISLDAINAAFAEIDGWHFR